MATTSEEFAEIFDSEEFSLADLDKLREAARHGIPHSMRAEAWTYLLGIHAADKESLRQEDEYALIDKGKSEVSKRLRGEATRFYSSRISAFKESDLEIGRTQKSSRDVPGILESVITGFLNVHSGLEYTPGLVALCGPLVALLDSEHEIYYAFEKLLGLLEDWYAPKVLGEHVSHFQMLFLALIPDLYAHFEDEDLDMTEIGRAWFQSLLARELPLNATFRLWDVYLSSPDALLEEHTFVSLAILSLSKEILEELEQSDIRSLLMRLPQLDIDQVLSEAARLRGEAIERDVWTSDLIGLAADAPHSPYDSPRGDRPMMLNVPNTGYNQRGSQSPIPSSSYPPLF